MKLKKTVFTLAFVILLCTQACNYSNDTKLEYIPVKVDKVDKWGMVDASGNLLFSDEFDNMPSVVVNGVFSVEENTGYSLYKAESKPTLIPGAENLKQAGFYTEGLIPVVKEGERITLLDIKGETKFTLNPINGKEVIRCDNRFRDGNLRVGVKGEKWGSVDKRGNVVISPIYDWLVGFSEGICVAGINDEETKELEAMVGFNDQGEELFRIRGPYELTTFSLLFGYQGGRLVIKKGDALGYLDKKGNFNKLPSKYSDYKPFSNKYYGVENTDGKWGLVNENNDVLIRPKYDNIDYVGDGLFCVKNNDRYQLITSDGDLKVELDEKDILSLNFINQLGFSNPFCLVGGKANSYMFFNRDGKPISNGDFYNISVNGIISYMLIESNYMDVTAIAHYIANGISQTGFGRIQLGSPISNYITDKRLEKYSDSYSISLDLNDFEFLNASASLRLISYGESIVLREPIYSYDNYYGYPTFEGYQYSWNPASKVGDIVLSINGTGPLKKCAALLADLIKAKGFKVERQNEEDMWQLKEGNTNVYIKVSKNSNDEEILDCDIQID